MQYKIIDTQTGEFITIYATEDFAQKVIKQMELFGYVLELVEDN